MQATLRNKGNMPLRWALFAGVLINLVLTCVSLALHPALLGSKTLDTVIMSFLLLFLYALIGFFLTRSTNPLLAKALQQGTLIALICAGTEVINISIETLVDLTQEASTIATLSFMLLLFLLFGVAGFVGTRSTGTLRFGLLASVWCAMGSILLTVLFGFSVNFLFTQRLSSLLASDMVHSQSGLTDVRIFAVYNTLDSASSHLLEGPILALIFGALGGLLWKGLQRWRTVHIQRGA